MVSGTFTTIPTKTWRNVLSFSKMLLLKGFLDKSIPILTLDTGYLFMPIIHMEK